VHLLDALCPAALPQLAETYCGTIAYELEHLSDHQQRVWLRQAIESSRYRQPLAAEEKKAIEQRGTTNLEAYDLYLRAQSFASSGLMCP